MSVVSPTPEPAADPDKPLKDMNAEIAKLRKQTDKPEAEWDKGEIKRAASALSDQMTKVDERVAGLKARDVKFENLLSSLQSSFCGVKKELEKSPQPWFKEGKFDIGRLVFVWGLALLAWSWVSAPTASVGWFVVGAIDLYIVLILASASIRSDVTYGISHKGLRDWLYELMPTRLVAAVLVAGLFCAIWWGFAVLYGTTADPTTLSRYDASDALDLSFVTLATFSGPGDNVSQEARHLILCELANAILLVLGIFSMLINRLSEF